MIQLLTDQLPLGEKICQQNLWSTSGLPLNVGGRHTCISRMGNKLEQGEKNQQFKELIWSTSDLWSVLGFNRWGEGGGSQWGGSSGQMAVGNIWERGPATASYHHRILTIPKHQPQCKWNNTPETLGINAVNGGVPWRYTTRIWKFS